MLGLCALLLAIPLHFEPNQGQWQPEVLYSAITPTYTLALSDTGVRMNFPTSVSLRMNLPRTAVEGLDRLPGNTNYYFGADSSKWQTSVPAYARVRYRAVFPGVDLLVYGKEQQIEYDWVVTPGSDPSSIHFDFTGASRIHVDRAGDLVLATAAGEIRHAKPYLYQVTRARRHEIAGGFVIGPHGEVRFRVGK
jgi:hypothetical protein